MQCKKCGQNITNPRAKFCPVCGSPLEQTSSSGNSAPSPRTSAARPAKRRENWERYESPYAWVKWVVLAVAVVVLAVGAAVAMVLLNQQAGKENPRREDPSGSSSVTAAASPTPAPEETPSPAPEEDEEEEVPTPMPEPTPTPEPALPQHDGETIALPGGGTAPVEDFLFPYSSTELLTYDDLDRAFGDMATTDAALLSQHAINEIYARYGYNFHPEKSESAQLAYDYFNALDWYTAICGSNTASNTGEVPVSDVEQSNIETIVIWQENHGCR